jgi:hypothetical protein
MSRRAVVALAVVVSTTSAGVSGADATARPGAALRAATPTGQTRSSGLVRECRAKSVRRDEGFVFQPAGSVAIGVIRFSSASSAACILPRHIRVRFVAPRHGQHIQQVRQRLMPGEIAVQRLPSHRTVLLRIDWGNWCGRASNSLGRSGALPRALIVYSGVRWPLMRLPVNGTPECYLPSQAATVGVIPFFRVAHPVG